MRILHIANSYGGTTVYTNLIKSIDAIPGIEQLVYVPLNSRNHDRIGKKLIEFKNENSEIHYSTVLKSYHRFFYTMKINRIVRDISERYDLKKIDIIHTGTAFLDGAVAYELYKKYKIPYIITVRDTDVNSYYEVLKHKRRYFHNILLDSSWIVFISPRYKEYFLGSRIPNKVASRLLEKTDVRTNGVDEIFLKNIIKKEKNINPPVRLLYTGAFIPRKALVETILAVKRLVESGQDIHLTAVGRGLPFRPNDKEYISKIDELGREFPWLTLKNFKPLDEIIGEMRESDIFIMNSHSETFGLCYVEALTQGIPVIYTKRQGFDGLFPEGHIGYSVDSHNIDDIADGIEKTIANYKDISKHIADSDIDKKFDWHIIADNYYSLYKKVLNK